MTDVHDRVGRSRNMSAIRGRDTTPELALRRSLHRLGYRYSLHRRNLPGTPDLFFRKHRAVLFVNGCFWHGHDCPLFKWPQSNTEFWKQKIEANRRRDAKARQLLAGMGLRQLTVWECALRGSGSAGAEKTARLVARWLSGRSRSAEIARTGLLRTVER